MVKIGFKLPERESDKSIDEELGIFGMLLFGVAVICAYLIITMSKDVFFATIFMCITLFCSTFSGKIYEKRKAIKKVAKK